ncbi:MAG: hypothetical protein AAF404_00250 [Pseudomonadota bacterium]
MTSIFLAHRSWPIPAAVLALALTASAQSVYGATAAGTQIKNLATVTYEDAAGNVYSAQSNEAVVTVAQVYSASIGQDINVDGAPGQPVYLPFVVENTGNGTDTFVLTASDGITGGDLIDADSIKIYEDVNGDGQASSGEPEISSISLTASSPGNIKSIVVEVLVPSTAQAGDTLGITLTAEAQEGTGSAVANSVTDTTAGKGLDGLDGTTESMITVTGNAVIVATKSAAHDVAASEITYTLTVRNNGNAPAQDVIINDAFPANTTYVASSATAAGLLVSNGDTLPAVVTLDEVIDGIDYNGDGDTLDTGLSGLSAVDVVLGGSEISITYKVTYDPGAVAGGTVISNTAYVVADVDGDGNPDAPASTNMVYSTIANVHGVTVADTGENTGGDQTNDGQDDDALNGVQLVDEVAAGATVSFKNVITNTGNTDDIIELSLTNSPTLPFPPGTVFTFWDDTGLVQLTDSNGLLGVDAGLVNPGQSVTITVKASLPASVSGNAGYEASLVATSAADPDADATMTERLLTIVTPTVDIHNASGGTLNVDENPLGAPEYTAVNTHVADTGDTFQIPLWIDNDGDGASSFLLGAGASYDNAANTLGPLPAGWIVEYFLADGGGLPTGSAITSTPVIPGGTTDFAIIAEVTIPTDKTQALFDYNGDNDQDGASETVDGNSDGDGDYPLFFEVTSSATGATDVTMDAIDVNEVYAVILTPSGSDQIEAGGTSVYPHTLANNGNGDASLELTASNSLPGFTNTVTVDTDGDGVPDTEVGNLIAGNIAVQQPDGTTQIIAVTISGGNPVVTLPPGVVLPLTATVFAPTSAAEGQVDTLTITATNTTTGAAAPVQNQSQVVAGQVRITKTVAVDTDCDNTAETAFAETQTSLVEPGQCVIWQVVAENQGTADALKVVVSDSVPSFTTFLAGSLQYCINATCTPLAVTDGPGDDAGEHVAGNVSFYIGAGSDPATSTGGTLVSGDQATVLFTVVVD